VELPPSSWALVADFAPLVRPALPVSRWAVAVGAAATSAAAIVAAAAPTVELEGAASATVDTAASLAGRRLGDGSVCSVPSWPFWKVRLPALLRASASPHPPPPLVQAKPLWKVRVCASCRRLIGRDRNAALNILLLGLVAELGEKRPSAFVCTSPFPAAPPPLVDSVAF